MTEHAANCRFEDGEFVFPVRVYYEDTDFSGFVYHANYLKFFERCRTEALRLAGVSHHDLLAMDPPAAIVVRHMEIDFLRPAVVEDDLIVRARFTEAKGARVRVTQVIEKDGAPLARAQIEAAFVTLAGRPIKIPSELMAKLERYIAAPAP